MGEIDHKDHIMINGYRHELHVSERIPLDETVRRSQTWYQEMDKRRSVRTFSDEMVPREVIEHIIMTASTAPSGAHRQPWTFCAVSNPQIKSQIRVAAEKEEKESYEHRMSERWKRELAPIGTDMHKPFLEIAPWLIVAFKRVYEFDPDGSKHNNYYVNESVGIACGILIAAIHHAGLVTLTHTPSPMNFLADVLKRPKNERAYLLLPVGYPQHPTYVPSLERKPLAEVAEFYT